MKTTVYSQPHRVIVDQAAGGCVLLSIIEAHCRPAQGVNVTLTEEQAGALIFGIEKAAEAARIAQERETLAA